MRAASSSLIKHREAISYWNKSCFIVGRGCNYLARNSGSHTRRRIRLTSRPLVNIRFEQVPLHSFASRDTEHRPDTVFSLRKSMPRAHRARLIDDRSRYRRSLSTKLQPFSRRCATTERFIIESIRRAMHTRECVAAIDTIRYFPTIGASFRRGARHVCQAKSRKPVLSVLCFFFLSYFLLFLFFFFLLFTTARLAFDRLLDKSELLR